MTMANVHEAMITSELVQKCKLSGRRDSAEHCATWHRNLNGLKNELFQSLDAIGWHELSDASSLVRNKHYPPDFQGTSDLKSDLLAICDHLALLVQTHRRNLDVWKLISQVELVSATSSSIGDISIDSISPKGDYEALLNENRDLKKRLKDWARLAGESNKKQRASFLRIIVPLAVKHYGYTPGKPNSAAKRIADEAIKLRASISERRIRTFLNRGSALLNRDDTWDDDWREEC